MLIAGEKLSYKEEVLETLMQRDFSKLSFAVIDLETTGFSSHKNEIIEVGLVKVENLSIKDTYHSLVKPKGYLPLKITEITGLNGDFLVNAPELSQIKGEIESFIKNKIVVEHSQRTFDMAFLKNGLNMNEELILLNTLKLFGRMKPRPKKKDLASMCRILGVELPNHHYALNDAMATADALIKMLKIYIANGIVRFGDFPMAKELIKWV